MKRPSRPERVPTALRPLLSVAARWVIGDDGDRENAIDSATAHELRALVDAVEPVREELYAWLAGPEADRSKPTQEYISLSIIAEAEESAALRLAPPRPRSREERARFVEELLRALGGDEDP